MRSFETDGLRVDDAVTFSPDDRFLASANDRHLETPLTEWDLETGGRRLIRLKRTGLWSQQRSPRMGNILPPLPLISSSYGMQERGCIFWILPASRNLLGQDGSLLFRKRVIHRHGERPDTGSFDGLVGLDAARDTTQI